MAGVGVAESATEELQAKKVAVVVTAGQGGAPVPETAPSAEDA